MAVTDDNGVDVGNGQIREGTSLGESRTLVKTALQAACAARQGKLGRQTGACNQTKRSTSQQSKIGKDEHEHRRSGQGFGRVGKNDTLL